MTVQVVLPFVRALVPEPERPAVRWTKRELAELGQAVQGGHLLMVANPLTHPLGFVPPEDPDVRYRLAIINLRDLVAIAEKYLREELSYREWILSPAAREPYPSAEWRAVLLTRAEESIREYGKLAEHRRRLLAKLEAAGRLPEGVAP